MTLAIAFAAFLFAADCSGVMIVQGFTEERHDRFAARTDPADFVASGFDLSGVGRATSGWVTLLANPTGGAVKHFASAHHAQPSGNVSFFPGNDPDCNTSRLYCCFGRFADWCIRHLDWFARFVDL